MELEEVPFYGTRGDFFMLERTLYKVSSIGTPLIKLTNETDGNKSPKKENERNKKEMRKISLFQDVSFGTNQGVMTAVLSGLNWIFYFSEIPDHEES